MSAADDKRITVAVIGAGDRGWGFAGSIKWQFGHLAEVVAVAEPRDEYRAAFAEAHDLPPDRQFSGWEAFCDQPTLADAVIIATPDREHAGPAVRCLDAGYHVLLEKPLATTLADCRAIADAERRNNRVMAVCHSMRYNKLFARGKEIIASGRLGKLIGLDMLEPVKFWHQAHSFVRGNWGNEARSTFMLMGKCCHDVDYLAHLAGKPCRRVASFGALHYFREENAPAGAPERCTDGCPAEPECEYSAYKRYVNTDRQRWPAAICSRDHSCEAHLEAIRTGPYGRCVFHSDNDVVDHQVVAMDFETDIQATLTMTAFMQAGGRKLRAWGTAAEMYLDYDNFTITVKTFADMDTETLELSREPGGHSGGDTRTLSNWLAAIAADDPAMVLTDAVESLRTHTIVFASELSRREKRMVEVTEVAQSGRFEMPPLVEA